MQGVSEGFAAQKTACRSAAQMLHIDRLDGPTPTASDQLWLDMN
jgi:hypothetical protein